MRWDAIATALGLSQCGGTTRKDQYNDYLDDE